MKKFYLYFHTLRYLKYDKLFLEFFIFLNSHVSLYDAPLKIRPVNDTFCIPSARLISLLGKKTFFFLNKYGQLSSLGWKENPDTNSIKTLAL